MQTNKELSYFEKALSLYEIGYGFTGSILMARKIKTEHLAAICLAWAKQQNEKRIHNIVNV
ncbi:MAG TPA: hypothetical protein DDW51_21340 [Cyanobacteria bacterium UBA11367]|nr:hypothetical protein [Cyanobacteria bacterium UBA11367]